MMDLYCSPGNINEDIQGYSYTDKQTKEAVKKVYQKYNYIIDPHGAVGYLALKEYLDQNPSHNGLILETAHYSKFKETVDTELEFTTEVPDRLAILEKREKKAKQIDAEYDLLKEYLLEKR